MYEIIIPNTNVLKRRISLKHFPVYSKRVSKTNKISPFFNKREHSKYNKSEQEAILIPFSEFISLNHNIVTVELNYQTFDNINVDQVTGSGVDYISNIEDYTVIYDIDSGYIGITLSENIIIN